MTQTYIFGPFCGGGLPGVNLSEQGNAGWRTRTMRRVHAAKYDVASMILQNKKLFKFNRNIEKSDGEGPSQRMWISCDRGEQCRIGEDFVDILSDDEALEQEANEANNPTWFLPKRKTKHRPPAMKFTLPPEKKNTSKDPPKKKQRTGNKRKKDDVNEVPLDVCEDIDVTKSNDFQKKKQVAVQIM